MTTVPAPVLLARLEHELTSAELFTDAGRPDMAARSIDRAMGLARQLKEALR